ncbi:helix-turn-helix domain-containing protein [Paraburkholderia sp.]|jgi:AraC-like DNA-binding protein|uniref:helix-turn-helix domain-containing protein n=1 Tax=Paraburkholderia sp. TaxID=1926495 RepID=UPI002F3FAA1E
MLTSSFSTRALAAQQQVLAWRTRVGHVVDVPPSSTQLAEGFGANIDLFAVGTAVFTDVRTDAMVLERSVARVSTDARRDYVFHLFVEGETGHITGMHRKRSAPGSIRGLVALDLNQPFRVERPACRVLSLFVPRTTVDAILPDGESIHGRIMPFDSPLARLALDHLLATRENLATRAPHDAAAALDTGAQLLLAAFHQQASLTGSARAAVQAAVMAKVRRFVDANLHQAELTPASVVDALQLKRATIYRWFQHEGGLGTYIRNRRLLEAADELAHFPQRQITEIAYGLGFKSGSDFTRAFRRAFDISPLDMRARALALLERDALR